MPARVVVMLRQNLIAIISGIGLSLQLASTAMAQSSGGMLHMSKSFQSVAYNPSEDSRRMVIRELLSADNPLVQMPPFPRVWYQAERGDSQEANTSFGLSPNMGTSLGGISLGGIGIGGKVSINYTYARRHFLVVMMSTRQANAKVSKISENPLTDINEITRFDPTTQRRFFNAKQDFPMVGFCAYEMSLKIARTKEGSIFFPGFNQTENISDYQAETITLYSNFFQIEPHVPMMDYLNQKCGGVFLNEARPFVENDFNKIVLEYYTNYHPKNNCRLGGESSEAGDHTCLGWFKTNTDQITQKIAIPRCVQQSDGTARCVLRAKAGSSCPMYLNSDGKITEEFSRYREATLTGAYSRSCDSNLKCTMERQPFMIGPVVLWPGTARCR